MTFQDILNGVKDAASFGVWGASKLLAKPAGDPQEGIYNIESQLSRSPQMQAPNLNQPGLTKLDPGQGSFFSNLLHNILGATVKNPVATVKPTVTTVPQPTVVPPKPTTTSTPTTTQDNPYKRAIEEGFKNWGNPPAATLSGQMADYATQYPIFKQYPFLLPAITLAETGGGSKVKKPNNWTNWGIYQSDYNPDNPQYNLDRTASGIADRTPYYEDFRRTGKLEDLAKIYAPTSDNPTTGGNTYADNLRKIMAVFASKM